MISFGVSSRFVIDESWLKVRIRYDLIAIAVRAPVDRGDRRNRLARLNAPARRFYEERSRSSLALAF